MRWSGDACLMSDFGESIIVVVVVQEILAAEIGYIKIHIAVVVVIRRRYAFGEGDAVDAGGSGDILEGSVTFIKEELRGTVFIGDEEVEDRESEGFPEFEIRV